MGHKILEVISGSHGHTCFTPGWPTKVPKAAGKVRSRLLHSFALSSMNTSIVWLVGAPPQL